MVNDMWVVRRKARSDIGTHNGWLTLSEGRMKIHGNVQPTAYLKGELAERRRITFKKEKDAQMMMRQEQTKHENREYAFEVVEIEGRGVLAR